MRKFKILSLVLILMVGVVCFSACKFEYYKTYTLEILTDNMAPTLEVGDKVKVRSNDTYKSGDIIAYSENNLMYISRIVFVLEEDNKKYYICHSDNNVNLDGTAADGEWEDDAAYLQDLVDNGATKQDVIDDCGTMVAFVTFGQIQGVCIEIIKK